MKSASELAYARNYRVKNAAAFVRYTATYKARGRDGKNARKEWTDDQLEIATGRNDDDTAYTFTASEAARLIGRSVLAVERKRHRQKASLTTLPNLAAGEES